MGSVLSQWRLPKTHLGPVAPQVCQLQVQVMAKTSRLTMATGVIMMGYQNMNESLLDPHQLTSTKEGSVMP